MNQTILEFFHDFRQDLLAGAEANLSFQLSEFMGIVSSELVDTGFIDGYEFCHYRAQRGIRVDGYWFDDEGTLDLFIADFECRNELASLTKTEVDAMFRRLMKFFEVCIDKNLHLDLEETSPEYGLAREILDRKSQIRRVNFFLISERILSDRIQSIDNTNLNGINTAFHVWDVSRLQRQRSSRGHKEILDIDFSALTGSGVSCLPAHLGSGAYQAYLVVLPASVLSDLYERYGSRLLEQNVRCFLQARGNVNKGIRTTILNEPEMFFAYNNGITATAQEVDVRKTENGLEIVTIKDLQIVNGGQTTASLFHTHRKDKASLEKIFVQMKLSVISESESDTVVPRISEYANTQNRVNAADFFSNHPFHIRIEEFSRRIWAPTQDGALRETKWFYERARGQYADAQSKLTQGERKRFQAEYPKPQMFTKTDLAKFENVWDEKPTFVNLGAQKNFAQYAKRIGQEWNKSPDTFNEFYYKRAIVRAILFRKTEKMVSAQPWYNGGYRANIVAYTLALLAFYCEQKDRSIDFMALWKDQAVPESIHQSLAATAKLVNDIIINPEAGISNVTEWCKKELCWQRLQKKVDELDHILPREFKAGLILKSELGEAKKSARQTQKMDNGIEAQKMVMSISGPEWQSLLQRSQERELLTQRETEILRIATQIPRKIPSEKQSMILIGLLEKAHQEGIVVNK